MSWETWGMSAKKIRADTGNRPRHKGCWHSPLKACEARVYLEGCPLGPQEYHKLVGIVCLTIQSARISLWLRHDTPIKDKQEDQPTI